MLYLTDVKEGDGGIWLVEKSHKYFYEDFDKSQLIEVTASAGSLIFFDMEMIHRAGTPLNNNNVILFALCWSKRWLLHADANSY